MMKRLMPLFEQFAAKETTDAVRAHMEALANTVSEGDRLRDDESMREGIRPLENTEDQEKSLLDKIDRDKARRATRPTLSPTGAALQPETATCARARYVEKIEETRASATRRAPFMDANWCFARIEKKDADRMLEMVRIGRLTLHSKDMGADAGGQARLQD